MVYVLLGTGFEEMEVVVPTDILRRGGVDVKLVALEGERVLGGHGMEVKADMSLAEVEPERAEAVFVPGGMGGVNAIQSSEGAKKLIGQVKEAGGYVSAICAGPTVLAGLGLLKGKRATCYPGLEDQLTGAEAVKEQRVVVDGKIVTSQAPGTAYEFGLKLLELLKGKEVSDRVREEMRV